MFFPRPTTAVDCCVAVVCGPLHGRFNDPTKVGKPITWRRPTVYYKGELWRAHRLSYHLNVGRVPRIPASTKTGRILHTCDNAWCILPGHLYKGTQKRNIHDMLERHPTIHISRSVNMLGNKRAVGK